MLSAQHGLGHQLLEECLYNSMFGLAGSCSYTVRYGTGWTAPIVFKRFIDR